MNLLMIALFFALAASATPALDNDFVSAFRDSAPCASGAPSCGERVFVALGPLELGGQKLSRGEIRVFKMGERYSPPQSGEYLEVAVKPGHPKAEGPGPGAPPPPKNKILYVGRDFTVFEESMQPGEKSEPHSHNQRVAIFLNHTQVEQWAGGKSATLDEVADTITFRPAVVHASKDVGSVPIRNILIEFHP